jgi:dTDP-4-amino-4,6-dideoxygalactose transaminase
MLVVGEPKILNKPLLMRRLESIIDTHQFSNNGPFCQELEVYIKNLYQIPNVVIVNNATAALEIVLAFLKERLPAYKTQVIVPSFTFVATAAATVRSGFTPVFADINPSFGLDYDDVQDKINKKTAGIIPCNLFGNLNTITNYPDIFTLHDSSHALNICDFEGTYVGNFGDAEVISGHPTKLAGGFELGLICTRNAELAEFAIKYRNFGFDPKANRQGEVVMVGSNYKASEAACAAYLTQLECIEEIESHYYDNHMVYNDMIPDLLCQPNQEFTNYSYVIIRSKDRDALEDHLIKNGVFARVYFNPIHRMLPYSKYLGKSSLPNTDLISSQVLALPTGLNVKKIDVEYVCKVIKQYVKSTESRGKK